MLQIEMQRQLFAAARERSMHLDQAAIDNVQAAYAMYQQQPVDAEQAATAAAAGGFEQQ